MLRDMVKGMIMDDDHAEDDCADVDRYRMVLEASNDPLVRLVLH